MKSLYKDTFDLFVCHSGDNAKDLKLSGVFLFDQRKEIDCLSIKPESTSWKLYPPRLRIGSHEIFIDNDVVVYKRHPVIEHFLSNDDVFFCTEAAYRMYGKYDHSVKSDVKLNTGFFGLPPNFDFKKSITEKIKGDWETWFDEQGLVSSILLENKRFSIIKMEDIWVCVDRFLWGEYGIHFVGLNKGRAEYWKYYNDFKIKLI